MGNNQYIQNIRKLIIALTISGALNIFLLSGIIYWLLRETPPSPYFEHKPALRKEQQSPLASERGNAELIHYFRTLSFDQLVDKLENNQLIENGYSQRDIALASLVAFHHLDLARALVGQVMPTQERTIIYGQLKSGKPATITIYPELSDQQFQAVIDFVKTERWPLTSKGLFWALKKQGDQAESTLYDAFAMTPEFLSIELLFNRAEGNITKEELQRMLLDGTWAILSDFTEKQKLVQDLSPARRQHFLLEYINRNSSAAAYLMLKSEGDFTLKKLDDDHIVVMLGLMNNRTAESEKFALDLLTRPRSDSVWRAAAAKLYQYAGEAIPEKNLHHLALTRFNPTYTPIEPVKPAPQKPLITKQNPPKKIVVQEKKNSGKAIAVKTPTVAPAKKKDRLYIVQDGDNLWKISKRFNIDINVLKSHNKLKNDALKPGTTLKIPS